MKGVDKNHKKSATDYSYCNFKGSRPGVGGCMRECVSSKNWLET